MTGDWGLGTGDWGLGTGDWGLGTGDWRLGTGEWGMGNGEWGMVTGDWGCPVLSTQSSVPIISHTMHRALPPPYFSMVGMAQARIRPWRRSASKA